MLHTLAVSILAAAGTTHDHAHSHGRVLCGCEATEKDHPFTIDCSDAKQIRDAAARLKAATPSKAKCEEADSKGVLNFQKDFFIVQAHHDHCDHDTLTTAEEKLFHDWEGVCKKCGIERKYNPKLKPCAKITCSDTSVIDSSFWILNTTCKKAGGHDHAHRRLAAKAWEWAGTFEVSGNAQTWIAQKIGGASGAYKDPSMKMAVFPATDLTSAGIEAMESKATTALGTTCIDKADGTTIKPEEGKCFKITFDASKRESTYTIDTTGITGVIFFTEHGPTEFEDAKATDGKHYFATAAGADIEPKAQEPDPKGRCCSGANANAEIGAFKQVVAYHDLCDHDDIPKYVENGLHDYEANCAAHFCNAVDSTYTTACPSPPPPPFAPPVATMEMGAVIAIIVSASVVVLLFIAFVTYMICKEKAGKPIFTTLSPSGTTKA